MQMSNTGYHAVFMTIILTWYLKSVFNINARSLAMLGIHGWSDATSRE